MLGRDKKIRRPFLNAARYPRTRRAVNWRAPRSPPCSHADPSCLPPSLAIESAFHSDRARTRRRTVRSQSPSRGSRCRSRRQSPSGSQFECSNRKWKCLCSIRKMVCCRVDTLRFLTQCVPQSDTDERSGNPIAERRAQPSAAPSGRPPTRFTRTSAPRHQSVPREEPR